jgi:hypothetical protein
MQNNPPSSPKSRSQYWWLAFGILIFDLVIITPFFVSLAFWGVLSGTLTPVYVLVSSCIVAILGGIVSLIMKKTGAALVFLVVVPFAAYSLISHLY